MVAELLGWFGAGLSCVISLPQVVRTMRAKQLDGISSATYWLVLVNAAAWTGWALLTGEYAAGVPALVNGPAAIVILHRLLATRHTARRREFDTSLIRRPWQVAFSRVFARCGGRAATPAGQSSPSRRSPRFGSTDSWLFAVGGHVCQRRRGCRAPDYPHFWSAASAFRRDLHVDRDVLLSGSRSSTHHLHSDSAT